MTATTTRPLTRLQHRLLTLIVDGVREHGRPPTIRALMLPMGQKCTNGVWQHLKALHRKGFIDSDRPSSTIKLRGVTYAPVFEDSEDGRRLKEALEERREA